MKKVLAGLIVGLIVGGCGLAAADNTANDHVLHQDKYGEFFKQEGSTGKNYLYTITDQPIPQPGHCSVYTFASETAGAVVCNFSNG